MVRLKTMHQNYGGDVGSLIPFYNFPLLSQIPHFCNKFPTPKITHNPQTRINSEITIIFNNYNKI